MKRTVAKGSSRRLPVTNFRLEEEYKQKLDRLAKEDNQTRTGALRKLIDEEENRRRNR